MNAPSNEQSKGTLLGNVQPTFWRHSSSHEASVGMEIRFFDVFRRLSTFVDKIHPTSRCTFVNRYVKPTGNASTRRIQAGGKKGVLIIVCLYLPEGSGPFLEVLQYQANPWKSRSKLLSQFPVPKISLISKLPIGERIRY